MMEWIKQLFSKSEIDADAIIVTSIIGLIAYLLGWSYALFGLHQVWDGTSFTTGLGIIVGAMAGAKKLRDGGNSQ